MSLSVIRFRTWECRKACVVWRKSTCRVTTVWHDELQPPSNTLIDLSRLTTTEPTIFVRSAGQVQVPNYHVPIVVLLTNYYVSCVGTYDIYDSWASKLMMMMTASGGDGVQLSTCKGTWTSSADTRCPWAGPITPCLMHWRRGVVASVVRRMNEITAHWARLVLGWVTVFGRVYHHGM